MSGSGKRRRSDGPIEAKVDLTLSDDDGDADIGAKSGLMGGNRSRKAVKLEADVEPDANSLAMGGDRGDRSSGGGNSSAVAGGLVDRILQRVSTGCTNYLLPAIMRGVIEPLHEALPALVNDLMANTRGIIASKRQAEDVLVELFRFLFLKLSVQEFVHGSKTSPSFVVDEAWHRLILRTALYRKVCYAMTWPSNILLDHDPDTALNRDDVRRRYENTLRLYKDLYGSEAPATMWPPLPAAAAAAPGTRDASACVCGSSGGAQVPDDSGSSDDAGRSRSIVGTAGASAGTTSSGAAGSVPGAEGDREKKIITIVVRDQNARKDYFTVSPSTRLRKVFEAYCTKVNIPYHQLRFFFDGKRCLEGVVVAYYQMEDDDQIDVTFESVGC